MNQRRSFQRRSGPAPEPPYDPTPSVLLTRDEEAEAAWSAMRKARRFAFDTEFVMEDVYHRELCLVQIAVADQVFLLDPYGGMNLAPLWELMLDPKVEVVVHAGQEDFGFCVAATGRPPCNVFDVQIAAGFVEPEYPLSLPRLLNGLLGVHLHKSQTLTDWRRRPLTPTQMQYARDDVAYLPPLHEALAARLKAHRRLSWAKEEMRRFEDPTAYARERGEEATTLRVKGMNTLSRDSAHLARSIAAWRDQLARRLNRPARHILKDYLILEIARHGLTSPEAIANLRGISLSKSLVANLCAHLNAVGQAPPVLETMKPMKLPSPTERTQILVELCDAVLRSECQAQRIATQLLYTKKTLTELVEYESSGRGAVPALRTGWRDRAAGRLLSRLLAGRLQLAVNGAESTGIIGVSPLRPNPKAKSPDGSL